MLKRSPRSKYISIASAAGSIVIIFIMISTITTWREDTINHGTRKVYYTLKTNFVRGDEISKSDLKVHEMYSKDAPASAVDEKNIAKYSSMYANLELAKNSILTKEMFVASIDSTLDEDARIIFVPSKDEISPELAHYADIIATASEGFGPEIVAENAEILFDAKPYVKPSSDNSSQDPNAGYFVRVSSEEAGAIANALATGELYLALKKSVD